MAFVVTATDALKIACETTPMTHERQPRAGRPRRKPAADRDNQADAGLANDLASLKVSPSSSTSTASSTASTSTSSKKPGKKRPPKAKANADDAPPVARALNANEMMLMQSLMGGFGASSTAGDNNNNNNSHSTDDDEQQPALEAAAKPPSKKAAKSSSDPVDKRDFLFSGLPVAVRSQLQLDDVAQYSVTDMKTAARISHFIMTLPGLTPNSVITDATACVGGNTASFCTFFRYVQAVEIDPTRFRMLVHNMHGVLTFVNIQCYCANYVDVAQQFLQDVVFIDPPWGGPEYRTRSTVDLHLGETPLADLCERLVGRTQYVVIKVPQNFDIERFTFRVSGTVSYITHFRKMAMVVVDYRFVTDADGNNAAPEDGNHAATEEGDGNNAPDAAQDT
ncbi:hypothetical protein SPRG_15036 [Saprolegnia parasitica CBS 223.65]|uniref:Trimethylguanosine synthase n=1 Tax=Saprolegnia parasitica (strain CBS 223.65) TaxID=695850 RepID=A0A067BR42_SAPPC|nr:hypothetical protein SPRG_15036 [Saprolegnia parasitica CBS 223.65]KDO19255.1 hypothetical protein SPRG_15036 [Saprolegnia parasitica CBS 223.65]|eukprot:XP_012210029.1 hypothetical protein SPRG_15036 [Saprolegnia parasitica CBS 223.65]